MQTANSASKSAGHNMERLMSQYQQADPMAAAALVDLLGPKFYRFFSSRPGNKTEGEDMLQDLWLRIHQARHTYRPSEPLLPWVYAIALGVRVDYYRKRSRIASHETGAKVLTERPANKREDSNLPTFEDLVAALPKSQREVLTMLKVNDLSIEEVARATSSTVGAVKQKAHRAYVRLRNLLETAPIVQPTRKRVAQ
ncbi:MAG: RNA polymerase sigma factor [Edaphobacter sp.]|jgi:RNA polymerase sigma-70 factor (ECF subfamily)